MSMCVYIYIYIYIYICTHTKTITAKIRCLNISGKLPADKSIPALIINIMRYFGHLFESDLGLGEPAVRFEYGRRAPHDKS